MTGVEKEAPREPEQQFDKIYVIQNNDIVLSTTGDYIGPVLPFLSSIFSTWDFNKYYLVGTDLYPCLARINKIFQEVVPGWKMRINSRRRKAIIKDGITAIAGEFFVDYIAIDRQIKGKITGTKRFSRQRIDIINLELIKDDPPKNPVDQLEMAMVIIDLQRKRGINQIKKTRGSIGAGLLKKSPLWNKGRHATPKFINEHSRKYLPGNYYSISNKIKHKGTELSLPFCYLIDQDNAHHSITTSIPIPHPNAI